MAFLEPINNWKKHVQNVRNFYGPNLSQEKVNEIAKYLYKPRNLFGGSRCLKYAPRRCDKYNFNKKPTRCKQYKPQKRECLQRLGETQKNVQFDLPSKPSRRPKSKKNIDYLFEADRPPEIYAKQNFSGKEPNFEDIQVPSQMNYMNNDFTDKAYFVEEPEENYFNNLPQIEYKPSNLQSTEEDVIYRPEIKLKKKEITHEINKVLNSLDALTQDYEIFMWKALSEGNIQLFENLKNTKESKIRELVAKILKYYQFQPNILNILKKKQKWKKYTKNLGI